ncbi:MAG TPA: hypothetical protein VFF55_09725 [Candidatus Deferrimicrobium sp.]|nr:hypothetical protein [Candidatus Deferrimicrobium sp.]
MLWLVRPAVKTVFRLLPIALSMLVGMALVLLVKLRQEQQAWGVTPGDANRPLAGDDFIADPGIVDTRSLVIDAPPAAVWPWLAQLGFGRGGWYSYDRMDMAGSSADRILPRFQDLAAGDIVPTHPGGGFLAKVVEPQQALVLYLDHELVRSQAEAAEAKRGAAARAASDQHLPGGLQFAGAMGGLTMPEFRATWSFVLEPQAGGTRTRLVERFRVWTADAGVPARLGMPMMGLGVFAMTRKHMLGLKERAEGLSTQPSRAAATPPAPDAMPDPVPAEA